VRPAVGRPRGQVRPHRRQPASASANTRNGKQISGQGFREEVAERAEPRVEGTFK